jgi:hypothetical protein
MSSHEAFFGGPGAVMTWIVVILLTVVALYLTRGPAHGAIRSLCRVLHAALRMASISAIWAESRLAERNREVLLAAGREAAERMIEREFERMQAAVDRDLAECPTLQRQAQERLQRIEEDHQQSTDVPPAPPGWAHAVEAIAAIPSKGDPMVANILDKIREALVEAQNNAREEYRAATRNRHQHLKNMLPHWRKVGQSLAQMDKNLGSLMHRAKVVDRQMDEYESILKSSDRAARMLSSSSLVQFFVSILVLAIAVGGAMINFHLIARPMAEMVGGNSAIGSFRISDIAALVIIMVEISMGLFLMESLRITRLFPVIGALPDVMRVRMIWITFGILLGLASVEAGLAYLREILLQDELATSAVLRGEKDAVFTSDFLWITTAAQMGMGFILPFALVFVAIPLETFVHASRTVLGILGAAFLRTLAVGLRMLGGVMAHMASVLVDVYDMIIFLPLWIERRIKANALIDRDEPVAYSATREMLR